MIPKIFHQVWVDGTPIPDAYKRLTDRMMRLHPSWTLRTWTDSRIADAGGLINQATYDRIPADCRPWRKDVVCYEKTAMMGGVHVDMDVFWNNPLPEELLETGFFAGYESPATVNNGLFGMTRFNAIGCLLVHALEESRRTYEDLQDKVGVRFFSRTVVSQKAFSPVTILPKVAFHRLHGKNDARPEDVFTEPHAIATHLFQHARSIEFMDKVVALAGEGSKYAG